MNNKIETIDARILLLPFAFAAVVGLAYLLYTSTFWCEITKGGSMIPSMNCLRERGQNCHTFRISETVLSKESKEIYYKYFGHDAVIGYSCDNW